jgi:hypothetical protein
MPLVGQSIFKDLVEDIFLDYLFTYYGFYSIQEAA